jgi:hypothetical protein
VAIEPDMDGVVLSSTFMICTAGVLLPQASVTRYVLVTTIGQVPVEASELVTSRFSSVVHASLIIKPRLSREATVFTGGVASEAKHPSTVVIAIVPVITAGVLSSTFIICTAGVLLPQASVTTYVRVTTIGQVPAEISELVTTRLASVVHASLIIRPRVSRPATVDTGSGASPATHPSTVVVAMDPVMDGAVLSSTFMICCAVLIFIHASVTTYVRVTTIGQVPVEASVLVTRRFTSDVHASLITRPRASSAATVVTGAGASPATHPSTVVAGIVPVMEGAVLSSTFMICTAVFEFRHASVTT